MAKSEEAAPAASPPPLAPEQVCRQLRKEFLIAAALPKSSQGIRREHLLFYRRCTRVLEQFGQQADVLPYRIAVHSLRGILLMHCGELKKAREDFEAALALFPTVEPGAPPPAPPVELPPGTPNQATLKLYHAITFVEEDSQHVADALAALPKEEIPADQELLTRQFQALADDFASRRQLDDAIAIYEIIDKYSLWDPDKHQDPKRVVEILKLQKENQGGLQ